MMSRYCGNCGSTDFTAVDGFFYCDICNTQSQVLREFDHDDERALLMSTLTTKIRRQKSTAGKQREQGKDASEEIVAEDDEHRLPAMKKEDFPKYLGHAGLRLATLTKLLSRYSACLIRDFSVPECVKLHVLNILQRYLQHYGIAFCAEELDEENSFCPLVKNEEYEAQKNAKEQKIKSQKEAQLKRGENVMTLISSADINANLDVQVTAADTEDLNLVMEQRTKLSMDAFSKLLSIPMHLEIIIAILYVGSILSGARWILLSDITRWFREGRFPMTKFHSTALHVGAKGSDIYDRRGLSFSRRTPTMPLHEYMRTILVISQLTEIPLQPVSLPFDQILIRLSYNLNLPSDFMRRLHAISIVSNPNVIFDAQFTRRFGIVDPKALFRHAVDPFFDNIYFALEPDTGRKDDGYERPYSVLPTTEIKAVAVILFALKLTFGLNDNIEFNMKEKVDALNAGDELFDFGVWLHQLKMRMTVWRGRRLKDVLEKRTTAFPSYNKVFDSHRLVKMWENGKGEKVSQIRGTRLVGGRNLYFRGCVPDYFVMEGRDYALFSTFEDDFDSKPTESLEKEALLTPLRYQATHNREWYEERFERDSDTEDLDKIDRYNAEVFFKSFKHHRMEYEAVHPPENTKIKLSEASCSSDETLMKWRQLFPCSERYEAYPRPIYSSGLLKPTSGELLYTPMVYATAADVIYQCASPYFSDTFRELLEILSLMIGEDLKVVYAFYLMLEIKCLMPETLDGLNEIAKNCENFTTCAQVELLGDDARIINIRMCRIDENVSPADYKFKIGRIGKIFIPPEPPRTCMKRTRSKSCGYQTPGKRSRRPVNEAQLDDSSETQQQTGVDEACDIAERMSNEELADNFERMQLRSFDEQILPYDEQNETISRPITIDDTESIQSLSDNDDEINTVMATSIRTYRDKDRLTEFSRTNVFKSSLIAKIKHRFAEYLNFEFEAAFALAISKYW